MDQNPYQSPGEDVSPSEPIRLTRGRRAVIVLAVVFTLLAAFMIAESFRSRSVVLVVMRLLVAFVPLVLIWRVWKGVPWARYALSVWCAFIFMMNLDIDYLVGLNDDRDAVALVFDLLLLCVLLVAALFSFFSPAISGLVALRRDERELA